MMDQQPVLRLLPELPDRPTRPGRSAPQGVPLTPGRSLAVDRKLLPLGAPLWLDTTAPFPTASGRCGG